VSSAVQTQLFTIAITLAIVARFLFRELRARTVNIGTLWVRPAVLVLLTAFLVFAGVRLDADARELGLALLVGLVAGVAVGYLVVQSTAIEPGPKPNTLRLRGSWITVVIWVVALVARLAVRLVSGGYSGGATSMVTTAGTLAMVAAAFGMFAILVAVRGRSIAAP
jgi:hypothetical protein